MTRRLSIASWEQIPAAARAPLDPRDLSVGIVHLGLGAFHRAHQAVYTERAMSAATEARWGICGVSERSRAVLDALEPQDGLYTVVERGPSTSFRVHAPLRELLFAREQQAALTARIATASTQIVSLTVTEKGYRLDPVTHRLHVDDEIRADAAGRPPVTVAGQLVRGLQQRMVGVGAPITVLSCDNLPGNGAVTKQAVTDFCALLPAKESAPLIAWIAGQVAFPSTMVDRIVPATAASDLADVASLLGLDDAAAVVTEPFSQWVIEDTFAGPRPRWELAGAIMTADVGPYEAMKLRLLNGTHSALAYLGILAGYTTVADFMRADHVADFATRLMSEAELALTVPTDFDLPAYERDLVARLSNPRLQHRLQQIATDGSQKLPLRLLGTIAGLRAANAPAQLATLAVAAWMRFVSADVDESGRRLVVDDPLAAHIATALAGADSSSGVVARLLELREIFGDLGGDPGFDLGGDPGFRADLVDALEALTKSGALIALRDVL